jgi:hypothetical protein
VFHQAAPGTTKLSVWLIPRAAWGKERESERRRKPSDFGPLAAGCQIGVFARGLVVWVFVVQAYPLSRAKSK